MNALETAKKAAEESSHQSYLTILGKAKWIVALPIGIVLIVMFTIWLKSPSFQKTVMSSAGAQKTFIVTMPPYGASQRFSVGTGETPYYNSEGPLECRWQCANGKISKDTDPKSTWCQGAIVAYWYRDTSGRSNSATVTIR